MLLSLYIKNFALIEEIEIEFDRGLNVITGETGAGKSILMGALTMILGERASTDVIRRGSDRAIIEGKFYIGSNLRLKDFIHSQEIEAGEQILLRREISLKGQNRCFINDSLITTNVLKSIGDLLVDLHGQYEHQYLLRQEVHIDILDEFAGLQQPAALLKSQFQKVTELSRKISDLISQKETFKEKKEIYEHQLKEISEVALQRNEDETLLQEEKLLGSSEKLYSLTERVYETLYDSDASALTALSGLDAAFKELRQIDARFEDIGKQFETIRISIEEIARWVGDYNHKIQFSPERLEEIRERLLKIQRLKKKYGSIDEILDKQKELEANVSLSENFEFELNKLKTQFESDAAAYAREALKISDQRRQAARKLQEQVVDEMKKLGMEGAQFITNIEAVPDPDSKISIGNQKVKATARGIDQVEFFLAANVGEAPKPLVKVASGGEISRIMLSLKTVLAETDQIPTLVFDEIDVGISGRIAQAVGRALHQLAGSHQTIAITHLPQIAGLSQTHFSVSKKTVGDKTITQIKKLTREEKIHEVAKLLGGESVTSATLENARELVEGIR